MHRTLKALVCCLLVGLVAASESAQPVPRWMTLPSTPSLPAPQASGLAPVNGISICYAAFGSGPPVILLHGGLANSNYWGHQVPTLAENHRVIVMDSRGHGRSTRNSQPYGYALMASDVIGLMDHLGIAQAAIVGWSDGAILGLSLAMSHPERVSRLFAFAANSDPSGVKHVGKSPVFDEFTARAAKEYEALSATPGQFKPFFAAAELDRQGPQRHQGADLDRRRRPRRGHPTREHRVLGQGDPQRRPAAAARSQSLLDAAGAAPVHRRCAALPRTEVGLARILLDRFLGWKYLPLRL